MSRGKNIQGGVHLQNQWNRIPSGNSYIGEAIDKEQRKMSNLFVSCGCDDSETVTDELAIIHPDNPRRSHNREVSKPYDYGHNYG